MAISYHQNIFAYSAEYANIIHRVIPRICLLAPLSENLARIFSAAITAANLGAPDYQKTLAQHEAYREALARCGLKVIVLDPDPAHPDAPFVEDTIVIGRKSAIITQLGDERRRGEEKRIAEELTKIFNIEAITYPGTVDGGDVLKIDNHCYIGISKRTNEDGAKQLANLLTKEGFTTSFIPVAGVLHLKTGITYVGDNTVVALRKFADTKDFNQFRKIVVDPDESYAANCLLVNGNLLIPTGYPKTKKKLQELNHNLIELEMSEFQKMDGGLTCLSVLF